MRTLNPTPGQQALQNAIWIDLRLLKGINMPLSIKTQLVYSPYHKQMNQTSIFHLVSKTFISFSSNEQFLHSLQWKMGGLVHPTQCA